MKTDMKIKHLQTIHDTNTLLSDDQKQALRETIDELGTPGQPANFVCPWCLESDCNGTECDEYKLENKYPLVAQIVDIPKDEAILIPVTDDSLKDCIGCGKPIPADQGNFCPPCELEEERGIEQLEDSRQNL